MSPFPTRERKPSPRTAPAGADRGQATEAASEEAIEFQPESGALAPCEPVDEEQLDHDRRDDL
jgi:hypothetical protein